jgi:hypothetical protein
MIPVELHCDACDISVTGRFTSNEFAALIEDDLHFLRIFIMCEGRIRDMESAMGVSYPTIKARMAELIATLVTARQALTGTPPAVPSPRELSVTAILKDLETGHISSIQAMESIKKLQKEPS